MSAPSALSFSGPSGGRADQPAHGPNPSAQVAIQASAQLQALEQVIAQMESQLLQGHAPGLEQSASALAQALLGFARQRPMVAVLSSPEHQSQLRRLSARFLMLREGMARRQASVSRELGILLPAARAPLYGQSGAAGGYTRTSGAHTSVRA